MSIPPLKCIRTKMYNSNNKITFILIKISHQVLTTLPQHLLKKKIINLLTRTVTKMITAVKISLVVLCLVIYVPEWSLSLISLRDTF